MAMANFPFKIVRNSMAILWPFEKQLLQLHDNFRRNYRYCKQLSKTNIWITDQVRQMKSPESELDGKLMNSSMRLTTRQKDGDDCCAR
jgi:hypothetical protein